MRLYNSLTREVELLEPSSEAVGIYACGITPYDTTHLGHAFTYAMVDVLVRYLEFQGRLVNYVQNVTDIDDDMLREAAERRADWKRLGNRWTAHFIEDMTALNIRPPDDFPRASAFMPEIIETVERLLAGGHAYQSDGGVYFDLESWPSYGSLSGLGEDQMLPIANERGNHPDDPNKRQPLDFVLWQAQAPGEPAWESPWGPGRPGWHVECTTLARYHLGPSFDLHAGGADLMFPHHDSEIAQSEALSDATFARHWMHTAMVKHLGQKMSKSLGNLVLVRDLLDEWSPNTIRLYLADHHYRQGWSHSEDELDVAASRAEAFGRAGAVTGAGDSELDVEGEENAFFDAMDDDLDSPDAIQALSGMAEAIEAGARDGQDVSRAQTTLRSLAGVLGLRVSPGPPPSQLVEGWRRHLEG